jgi:protein ImuA
MAPHLTAVSETALSETALSETALSETKTPSLESLLSKGVLWQGVPSAETPLWKLPTAKRDSIPFGAPEIDESLPHGGLACGAVHELSVNDRDGLVTRALLLPVLLARNALASQRERCAEHGRWHSSSFKETQPLIVWIGRRCWPAPFVLSAESLSSCLFIDPPTEKLTLWAIETALRSPAAKLVIADTPSVSLAITRRFALSARAHGTAALLIKRHTEQAVPSAAMTSWALSCAPSSTEAPTWELSLRRTKGSAAPITSWLVTVEDSYGTGADVSLRVLPRMVDTGHQAQAPAQRFGT